MEVHRDRPNAQTMAHSKQSFFVCSSVTVELYILYFINWEVIRCPRLNLKSLKH